MKPSQVRVVLLMVPALWGLVFVAVSELLETVSTFELVFIRFVLIGVLFGTTLLFFSGTRPTIGRGQWRLLVWAGFMGVPVSQLGIVYAQNFLAPALAAVLISLAPAITAVLAPLLVNERVSRRQAFGFAIASVGAIVVIVVGAGDEANFDVSNIAGAAVGLATPIGWALYTLSLKKMSGDHNTFGAVGMTLLVGSIFLLPFAPTAVDGASEMAVSDWAWMTYLAVGGTFVAYLIWYWSLKHLSASETSAYLYLVPVCALIWSILILREAPHVGALAGAVVVLAGVALTQSVGKQSPSAMGSGT